LATNSFRAADHLILRHQICGMDFSPTVVCKSMTMPDRGLEKWRTR
jgi:hypothetical protein